MLTRIRVEIVGRVTYFLTAHVFGRRVGPLMRLVFRIPVWLHQAGLTFLIPKWILILGTTGRRTGKARLTALEYGYDPQQRRYLLMTGWGGRVDWYRNACANPQVQVWLGKRKVEGTARPASAEEVAQEMESILTVYPKAVNTWSVHSGVPYDGTRDSLLRMAAGLPGLLVFEK